jgi:hypothetical protein
MPHGKMHDGNGSLAQQMQALRRVRYVSAKDELRNVLESKLADLLPSL